MSDVQFASGIYFDTPHEKAPDYVLGRISVNADKFIAWLEAQEKSEKGYVNMNVKRSKGGKVYVELDTWKPTKQKQQQHETAGADFSDDIPFASHEREMLV